ncbi:MAG TPA: hypothetical protein ENJ64_00065 [Thiotrichales bacterium]|nr:hypothetical protein [Thiotrichales bacterium]
MIKRFALLTFILLTPLCHAAVLSGEAYGPTREEARKNALATLAESLVVEIKSEFKSEQTSDGYTDASKRVHTTSDLPLLGTDFTVIDKKGEYYCTVLMNSDRALPLYRKELARLATDIEALNKRQKKQKKTASRYRTLTELLAAVEQFDKHNTVAVMLGGKAARSPVAAASVRSEILSIESVAPTLDIAADVLTRDLPATSYMVQAPLPAGSSQATAFSRIMRDKIAGRVRATEKKQPSSSYLKGSYEIGKSGITLAYRAVDYRGETVASRVVRLAPSAYRNIAYRPASVDFDQLLHEGYVRSNDFRAELNTNQGKDSLLFQPGQTIELFAKLNAPGYFYIVSHNTSTAQSYLLELNDAPGKRAFVRYVNADDANRWISLGEFEVSPPFGTENLQLVASSRDLAGKLPVTAYDDDTGLYIVQAATVKDAVIKTRGLKPKRKKGVKSAEATLSFTTMAK